MHRNLSPNNMYSYDIDESTNKIVEKLSKVIPVFNKNE